MTNTPEDPNSVSSNPIISKTSAMAGLKWVTHSFGIFGKNPSIWVVMLVIYFGISFLLTTVPILVLLPTLLAPIFNAGFVYAARAVDNQQMLQIDHLFAGFKLQLRGLFRLGMFYFLINLIIIAVVSIYLESTVEPSSMIAMTQAATTMELEQVLLTNPQLATALVKSLMLGFFLSIPLVMASWFAPALVLFNKVSPFNAMLLSIKACNKNILAFLFYSILMIPLLLLALLPFGLGLLVILPVIFISQYCSYKMIFIQSDNNQSVFIV